MAAALRECGDLLLAHGGHAMAAGVTAQPGVVDRFRAHLNELARASLKPEQLQPSLKLDGEISGAELTMDLVEQLQALAPTGQGNPPSQWVLRGVSLRDAPLRMGRENQHVKWRVTDGRGDWEAVWWNAGQAHMPDDRFDLAFTPVIDEYQGWRKAQLRVLDWRPAVGGE